MIASLRLGKGLLLLAKAFSYCFIFNQVIYFFD